MRNSSIKVRQGDYGPKCTRDGELTVAEKDEAVEFICPRCGYIVKGN